MQFSIVSRQLDKDGLKLKEMNFSSLEQRQNPDSINISITVRARLNNCRILQRNFEACVDAAQTSKVIFSNLLFY